MNNCTNQKKQVYLRTAGLLAILATIAVAIGDMLSLYSPDGIDAIGYTHLLEISGHRLTWGYYLGVIGLPFYILGFWQVYQGLKPAGKWRSLPIFLINVFVICIGTVTHGQTALLALVVQAQEKVSGEAQAVLVAMFDQFTSYYNPVLLMLRVLTLITAVWFIVAVLSKRTLYPRWIAFFSPWVLLIVLMIPSFISPTIGGYLLPPAFNIAHTIFFSASTILLWKNK